MSEDLRNDDSLFKDDLKDFRNDAMLKFAQDFGFYAEGYKEGAQYLVNGCTDEHFRDKIDIFIYPIMFNFRQYIELKLKEIITLLKKSNADESITNGHDLEKLWKQLSDGLKDFEDVLESEDFANAKRIILQFHDIDIGSMTFRYPLDKKGNKFDIKKERINVKNLGAVMVRLSYFLDSLSDYISSLVDSM